MITARYENKSKRNYAIREQSFLVQQNAENWLSSFASGEYIDYYIDGVRFTDTIERMRNERINNGGDNT